MASTHIARWDLDKTYLRTEFDTLKDLVKTALEKPQAKRTNPGASTLLREMVRSHVEVHILSGSPEQMRSRLESKLRLDGVEWESFTLKPNLQNMLRLRFRALRDQLGYKLPALLASRARMATPVHVGDDGVETLTRETLFGDDAEADAFVYSLYADIVSGHVDRGALEVICEKGRVYPDHAMALLRDSSEVVKGEVVERILIHLERQSAPEDFRVYGPRAVPFYNYLQAAFVVHEDGRVSPETVLRVGAELVTLHRFDGEGLARSYLDLARRGHLRGSGIARLDQRALDVVKGEIPQPRVGDELAKMIERLQGMQETARASYRGADQPLPDYVSMLATHNPRHKKKRA